MKGQFLRSRPTGRGTGRGASRGAGRGRGIPPSPRTGVVVESLPPPHDYSQLQSQIAQLQSHVGLGASSSSTGPTAAIAAGTPTALHGKLDHPTWILDSGAHL